MGVCVCVCACACLLCLRVTLYGSETETEDIIYSLSGRAIVCQEGLYCQQCQNNRIARDIPTEVCVCVCVCVRVFVFVCMSDCVCGEFIVTAIINLLATLVTFDGIFKYSVSEDFKPA